MLTWMQQDFEGRGIPSARLDAELLISAVLKVERLSLYLDLDRPLGRAELQRIKALVKRRRSHEPIAYILGQRDFWGRTFEVSPAVLIPRPDTETLIEAALAVLPEDEPLRILDLCTGSGCIGLTLAAERPASQVVLTDVSEEALAVAERNAERLGLSDRVTFRQGDLFDAIHPGERFDLIASNPPYIGEAEYATLDETVRGFEPRIALVAKEDGYRCYSRIADDAKGVLAPGGRMLLECGHQQAAEVENRLSEAGWAEIRRHRDRGSIERVVSASLDGD